jgi:hypothetical protein
MLNLSGDDMTKPQDSDQSQKPAKKSRAAPLASSDTEAAGLRVTRAEFSRIMECSKQAVTDWVKAGRIVVGADGRFDPRQAVRSLLATGDPAKIRARVLSPLVAELDTLRQRVDDADEDAKFQEECALELCSVLNALKVDLLLSLSALQSANEQQASEALESWLDAAMKCGGDPGLTIADFLAKFDHQIDSEPFSELDAQIRRELDSLPNFDDLDI